MKTLTRFEDISLIQKLGIEKAQIYFTGLLLLFLYAFYLLQDLFYVNGLNDFDEYFIRAEMWVNGEWNWGGGPDKLLSFIEYIPLHFSQHDFLSFYRTTNIVLATLLFLATFLFITKKNDLFPSYIVKLCASVLFLTMPFFIFRSLTIDASALLASMLLFFMVSYRNKYMGWLGLLIYLTRPEGIIIILFYFFFLIFDKKHRINIFINFVSFIVLLVAYKFIIAKYVLGTVTITGMPDIDNSTVEYVSNSYGSLIIGALKGVLYIPQYLFLFGMEILQNNILFFFYLVGIIVSLFNRKLFFFLLLVGGYAFMYMGLNRFQNPFEFHTAFDIFADKMEWINKSIEIANGRNMEFNVYGHTRYRVFFYPAIAVFVISGVLFVLKIFNPGFNKDKTTVSKTYKGKRLKKQAINQKEISTVKKSKWAKVTDFFSIKEYPELANTIVPGITVLFILLNLIAYTGFSKPFRYKNQMKDVYMNDYYKSGFEIRKRMKQGDIVFMPNLCNCNRAFIAEFLIFSGTRYTLIPVCENCNEHLVYGHPEKKSIITAEEIEKIIPSRNVFFDRYAVDYQKTFNDTTVRKIKQLYQKFDLNMLDSLNIHFVITPQDLEKPGLTLVKEIGEVKLYENQLSK
ncbi:MAG: hypothetical protein P1P88_10125 [Bacteroidales bacterium]|nr:hypothetical protein [Bacteroidales bacterium]